MCFISLDSMRQTLIMDERTYKLLITTFKYCDTIHNTFRF